MDGRGAFAKQLAEQERAAARREGVIEGLVIALQILDADHPGESQRIAAEIERLRGEA